MERIIRLQLPTLPHHPPLTCDTHDITVAVKEVAQNPAVLVR